MAPRFEMYVKAGQEGRLLGDCPFCQYTRMVMQLKVPEDEVTLRYVDFANKSDEFLQLNPKGTVPVLVNHSTGKVFPDSQLIVTEIDHLYPTPDIQASYNGPAVEACSGVLGKLFAFLKNNNNTETAPELRQALESELGKMDAILRSSPGPYLLGDKLSALDCSMLPKLRHVQVAGKYFQKFEIPASMDALWKYIKAGEATEVYKQTKFDDQEIIIGWPRHGVTKVD